MDENLLPTHIHIKNNQLNEFHGETPHKSPKYCTRTPPAVNFKSQASTSRHSTEKRHSDIVSYIIGKLNNYTIDNGDIEVYPSESMPDLDKTPINSDENDEMDHI